MKRIPRSEIQEVADRGECVAQAALRLGMSTGALRKRLATLGHKPAKAFKNRGRISQSDGTWVSLDAKGTQERDRRAIAEYLNRADLTPPQIAAKLEMTASGFYQLLKRYNVPKRRASFSEHPNARQSRMDKAVNAYRQGIAASEVAKAARMSLSSLYAELDRRGIKERPLAKPFAGKPKDLAKLLRIAGSLRAGMDRGKIALLEGMSRDAMGEFYRHWLKRWGEDRMARELTEASKPHRDLEEGE